MNFVYFSNYSWLEPVEQVTGALVMRNPGVCIAGMTGVTEFVTRILGPRRRPCYSYSFLKKFQIALGVFLNEKSICIVFFMYT